MSDLTALGLRELVGMLRGGQASPVEVAEAHLARIEALNPTSFAFISVCAEEARAAARSAAGKGPLHGAPYAVKDLFDAKGLATTCGSASRRGDIAVEDSEPVALLNAAGGVLLGKTNLHEFAYGATGENGVFGTCPNPHDPSRLAGGSSSGSAVAVAQGMVPFALGSDTGGSVRAPAALCGIVGFKPSYGRVSCEGVVPFAWSCDHVGWFTRRVSDAGLVFDVLAEGKDPGERPAASIRGLRIGHCPAIQAQKCDPEVRTALESLLDRLEQEGAMPVEIELPDLALAREAALTIQMAEAFAYHRPFLEDRGTLYSDEFRAGLAVGQFLLAEHYINAQRVIRKYRAETAAAFAAIDLLITPGCPIAAPAFGQVFVDLEGEKTPLGNALTRYTSYFNQTGQPALALPLGCNAAGLPLSAQLVGKLNRDEDLLAQASAVEAVVDAIG